jgi:hypothetical protein
MTRAITFTQAQVRRAEDGFVYVAQIGKHIKIGFSRDVAKRVKAFETSATSVEILLVVPGDIRLEKLIHGMLSEIRIRNELFHQDWRITEFVRHVEQNGIADGLRFLEETTAVRRQQKKEEDRGARMEEARRSKAEKDSYFASLVAQRKDGLGW